MQSQVKHSGGKSEHSQIVKQGWGEKSVCLFTSVIHGWIKCSKVVALMKVGYLVSGAENIFRLPQVVCVFVVKCGAHLKAQNTLIY